MALVMSAAGAMSPLSLMVAGPMSDLIGIRAWFWLGGLACLLMGAGAFFVPSIMNVEHNHSGQRPKPGGKPALSAAD